MKIRVGRSNSLRLNEQIAADEGVANGSLWDVDFSGKNQILLSKVESEE
ncbi:MAG: hypothetical protein V1678_05230 [Candidatus Aenigmatarchaeota archaeon]